MALGAGSANPQQDQRKPVPGEGKHRRKNQDFTLPLLGEHFPWKSRLAINAEPRQNCYMARRKPSRQLKAPTGVDSGDRLGLIVKSLILS